MKGLFIAALAFGALASGSAIAADMSAPAPVYKSAPPMLSSYGWTGFYLGINGGGGWGTSRFDFPGTATTTGNFKTSGGLFGGTAGFNFQSGGWVVGVEGDGDWANLKGSAPCPNPSFSCQTSDSWLATARGRFGVSFNEWLIYGTAGGAFGDVKVAVPGPVAFSGQTVVRAGWTAGAGVEYGFASNWSIKAEYLHIDLGSSTCALGNCAAISVANVPFHAEIFRVGLNYRFGGFGPMVARY
jgi:outer membrane immunogenic protein